MIKGSPGEKIVAPTTALYMLTLVPGACCLNQAWQLSINGTPWETTTADNGSVKPKLAKIWLHEVSFRGGVLFSELLVKFLVIIVSVLYLDPIFKIFKGKIALEGV